MSNQVKIISAEPDASFHKLNVDNIIVELPKKPAGVGQKGIWVNIKYKYGNNGKKDIDNLKIQTSELFSYGISRFEETSPPKMSLVMLNRKLSEAQANGENIDEDDLVDLKVENETIQILEDITEKIKELMKETNIVNGLGKQRDKKWSSNVDQMEIVKRKEQENGIDSVYVYAKVVTANNFMKTKFLMLDDKEEEGVKELKEDEVIEKLLEKNVNCRATAMLVIDSVFVGTAPHIQIKMSEVIISEFIEHKNKRNIIMPARFRNKSNDKNKNKNKLDSDDEDDTSSVKPKKIIRESDDSDSD